jgi:hypothetical protein
LQFWGLCTNDKDRLGKFGFRIRRAGINRRDKPGFAALLPSPSLFTNATKDKKLRRIDHRDIQKWEGVYSLIEN